MRVVLLMLVFATPALTQHSTESGDKDHELPLVRAGVLGTVNVLRDLDPKTFANRVTVACNEPGRAGKPELVIDGGGDFFTPAADKTCVLTFTLPAARTVSSLAVAYEYAAHDVPELVWLEGSADGGKTWFDVCKVRPRQHDVVKVFKPATADRLRLTQEGGSRRVKEVFVYADPDADPPAGHFNMLRPLYYANKITVGRSKKSDAWTTPYGGKSFPHVPFQSGVTGAHDGAWGSSDESGKRVFALLTLDKAYPMAFGVIGCPHSGEKKFILAGESAAEVYTADADLDPNAHEATSPDDLVKQGWTLQAAWRNDANLCKSFAFKKPGKYSRFLLVWDGQGVHPAPNQWSHLELFAGEEK